MRPVFPGAETVVLLSDFDLLAPASHDDVGTGTPPYAWTLFAVIVLCSVHSSLDVAGVATYSI